MFLNRFQITYITFEVESTHATLECTCGARVNIIRNRHVTGQEIKHCFRSKTLIQKMKIDEGPKRIKEQSMIETRD